MDHAAHFIKLVEEAKTRIKEISIEDMQKDTNSFVLIDVRELEEWSLGHLPQALHLARGVLERDIANHVQDKGQKIILYCQGGFRSALSADNLQKMGYVNVFSLAGGFKRWLKLQQPLAYD